MDLEQLYKEIQPNIYAFFYVKTMNRVIAEDLTQEVFYQAVKNFGTFSGKSNIKTWIFSIAKNILKKHYRTNKYKSELSRRLTVSDQDIKLTEDVFIEKEKQFHIIELINQLDDLQKEVVQLRIYGELSFKEIGDILRKSENYARVTFHRAKIKLQKELENDEG